MNSNVEDELFLSNGTKNALETLKFVKKFCGQTFLIKIGGAPLQESKLVAQLCSDLSYLRSAGISLVIVHGGGAAISEALEQNNISFSFHDGQRVTTPEMVKIVEMVLCGKVNRSIVRTLNSCGVRAVGLSGTDDQFLTCSRLNPKLGEVGLIEEVNTDLLKSYLESQSMQGHIPVIAPVGTDGNGQPLNINADWACVAIAKAMGISKVIYLTDQDGILNDKGQLISEIDMSGLKDLVDSQTVKGGMLAKTKTIMTALDAGIDQLHIINGSRPHSLIEEIFTDRGTGTICRAQWN